MRPLRLHLEIPRFQYQTLSCCRPQRSMQAVTKQKHKYISNKNHVYISILYIRHCFSPFAFFYQLPMLFKWFPCFSWNVHSFFRFRLFQLFLWAFDDFYNCLQFRFSVIYIIVDVLHYILCGIQFVSVILSERFARAPHNFKSNCDQFQHNTNK